MYKENFLNLKMLKKWRLKYKNYQLRLSKAMIPPNLHEYIETPQEFICPIAKIIMEDPVLLEDGHGFNKKNIKQWFILGRMTSPLTGLRLTSTTLIPNIPLKKMISDFIERQKNSYQSILSKSMRQFKDEMKTWKIDFYKEKCGFKNKKKNRIGEYLGEIYEGKRNGFGSFQFLSGNKYEGQFQNGKKEGRGIFTWGDQTRWHGDRYEGSFRGDEKNGKGIYYFHNGKRYEGFWENGHQEGRGILFDTNQIYDGYWSKGKKHGKGLQLKDGKFEEQEWQNGNRL